MTPSMQQLDSSFDDISLSKETQDVRRPTKRRLNNLDAIQVSFDPAFIQMDIDTNKPANYTVSVSFPGDHSPILEVTSVDGKLSQPVMEFCGCARGDSVVDEATGKITFPDGIVVAQSDKVEAGAKTTEIILTYQDTQYTISSRVEGLDYVAEIGRKLNNGAIETLRFGKNDQQPYVTYVKPAA